MGFPLHPLQHVVNVSWGGAIFVLGDSDGQVFYSGGKGDSGTQFQKVFVIGTDPLVGQCNGSSSALTGENKITAVVVGGHSYEEGHPGQYTIGRIVHSEDGRNWTTVLDMGGSTDKPTTVLKMIWDKDAKQFYSLAIRGIEDDRTSECWVSADGKIWSRISSQSAMTSNFNSTFESHCKYKDSNGAGFGDGEFGLDPSKKDSDETFSFGNVVADGLLITREDMNNCPVTFANGAWGRTNFTDSSVSELELSTDSGSTWKVVGHITAYDESNPTSGTARTLIAAPKKTAAADAGL